MASLNSDIFIRPIKYSAIGSNYSGLAYEYVQGKKPTQAELYSSFVNSVESAFGESSTECNIFKKMVQDCREHRITVWDIESRIYDLFVNHPELALEFCNVVIPILNPMTKRDDINRANGFIQSVKVAFPNDPCRFNSVALLIHRFQKGSISLKDMSSKMCVLLQNRNDLLAGYIALIPEAAQLMDQNGSGNAARSLIRRVIPYLCAVVVVLGIGIHILYK